MVLTSAVAEEAIRDSLLAGPVIGHYADHEEGDGEAQKHKYGSCLSSETDSVHSHVLLDLRRVHGTLIKRVGGMALKKLSVVYFQNEEVLQM